MEKSEPPFRILVMAGGTGSRMDFPDKGILLVQGQTLIGRNLSMLSSYSDEIYIAVSPKTTITKKVFENTYKIIETEGNGYSEDLNYSLKRIDSYPILTVAADLFIEKPDVIRKFIEFARTKGKGIVTLLSDGLFCGLSYFFSDPERIGEELFFTMDVKGKQVRNINTTIDFFALINRMNKLTK